MGQSVRGGTKDYGSSGKSQVHLQTMVGRPKSIKRKKCLNAMDKEEGLAYAIKLHHEDQEKPEKDRRSLRVLCREAEDEMTRRHKSVHINHVTLKNRIALKKKKIWLHFASNLLLEASHSPMKA